jgi:hypothetical protein
MKWKKAGRPTKQSSDNKPEWLEQHWTKEELSMATLSLETSTVSLAVAVIKQWKRDGCPENEKPGILPWVDIIRDYIKEQDSKGGTNEIRGTNESGERNAI